MRILVTGGTGKIGGELVRLLRADGHDAVPLSRGGAGGIALDVRDAAGLAVAARGFDAALLITPIGPDESEVGLAALAALRQAGVARVAYVGVMNIDAMAAIPHFATKQPIRAATIEGGGLVLDCNFFMQNDLFVLPAILGGGVYPLPVGHAGVEPVDTRDIAQAAARALVAQPWTGGAIPLCGPDRLDGPGYAASWSRVLGRPVVYPGDAIDPFIGAMRGAMGADLDPWVEDDFRKMMAVTQVNGCPATPAEVAAAEAAVGAPLRTHAAFAAEHVQAGGPS